MRTGEWIAAIAVFLLSGGFGVLSIRHFLERGYLLNNAWIFASEKERENMDKKPHYRQSAVVFCLCSLLFLIIGLSIVFHNSKLSLLEVPVAIAAIVYAIVSSIRHP